MCKGIVLAGGAGTRLHPLTKGTSKQLLPLFNKPMVYYPISTLMLAGIRDILIITTPEDQAGFKRMLGDGSDFGVKLTYAVQEKPNGLAEAFIIGKDFIGNEPVCLVLGDNIFHGAGFTGLLKEAADNAKNRKMATPVVEGPNGIQMTLDVSLWELGDATVFGYYVNDPERYGVAEFDGNGKCLSIEEKPDKPKSNYAVVGLYFYPNDVVQKAQAVQPSNRGELEITTLNQMYLNENRLKVVKFPRGFTWLDTGTFSSLMEASNYVQTIENRQGIKIACLEEIAYNNGWISKEKLQEVAKPMCKNEYGQYLLNLIKE